MKILIIIDKKHMDILLKNGSVNWETTDIVTGIKKEVTIKASEKLTED